jgi:hypothetical protein
MVGRIILLLFSFFVCRLGGNGERDRLEVGRMSEVLLTYMCLMSTAMHVAP